MNALLVPTLALDESLLDRLAGSLDYHIKEKVVINNGKEGSLDEWACEHPNWIVIDHPENLGVAGSWNLAPVIFPSENAWLICNDDVWFVPGYLKQFCDCIDANADKEPIVFSNDTQGYYCFAWTKRGIAERGTFDENFWPAYYEDADMAIRFRIAGKTQFCYACQNLPPMFHGKPKCGGIEYSAMLQGAGLFNRRYWERKWGTSHFQSGRAEYRHPFNCEQFDLGHWRLEKDRRRHLEALYKEFIRQPNASLYD